MTESFDPSQYLQQMASMRSSFGGPPTITTQISFGSKRQAYSPLSTRNTSDGAASPGQGQSTAFEKGFDDAIDKKMLAEKNDDERKKREQEADDALMKRFVDNTLKHLDKRSKAALKSAGVEHFFDYAHPLIHPIVANDYVGVMNVLQNVPIDGREEFVNKVDEVGGCPPIFYCLESHQLEILQLLLDYGADVNARNDLRNTPLHIACLRTQRRAVRALIFHGADAMVENSGFEKAHKVRTRRRTHIASTC